MSGIGVIINPHSRRNRARVAEVVTEFEAVLGDDGMVCACGDPESLQSALTTLRDAEISVLAICGGDGTYSYVMGYAEAVFGTEGIPPVALLRGGTMNTTANGLKSPKGKPLTLLQTLVSDVRAKREFETLPRPLMRSGERLGCLFGTGLVVRYLEEYYRRGRPHPTPWTAFTTLASTAGSATVGGELIRRMAAPDNLELEIDGEVIPANDYITIAAGTVPEFGLGFAPFRRCMDDPHTFELLATTVGPAAFLLDLFRMRTGRGLAPDHGLIRQAKQLVLRPTNGAETLQIMFDGDVMTQQAPVTVSVGPIVDIVLGARADSTNP